MNNDLQNEYQKLIAPTPERRHLFTAAKATDKGGLPSQVTELILKHAVTSRASDIHVEPMEGGKTRLRFRVDGQLYPVLEIPDSENIPIATYIKVLASLPTDAISKRKAHDGRFTMTLGAGTYDFRVATFPTIWGEKVAIRILNESSGIYQLDKLGFDAYDRTRIGRLLRHRHGLILVTGPTGSGKTSTLYALINELNSTKINVITLEDPVEYQLEGINQCDIKTRSDFNFAEGLKAILRQDPDMVFLGEIRDKETAEIALRASMTGRVVLSSLHANTAVGTVARLMSMGLEPFTVSYSLIGAIAQRLVRVICDQCKTSYTITTDQLRKSGINPELFLQTPGSPEAGGISYTVSEDAGDKPTQITLYKGKGCVYCSNTGYHGRVGVFEIVLFNDELRTAILKEASFAELQKIAVAGGTKPLAADAVEKVKKGITTLDEIMPILIEK